MPLKIGRSQDNQIIYQDESISKHHAILTRIDKDTIRVQDQSTNGTFINQQRIHISNLKKKDNLRLGNFEISASDLFGKAFKIWNKNQMDFEAEFAALIPVFNEYEKKQARISGYKERVNTYLRIGITLAVLMTLLLIPADWMNTTIRTSLMIGSGVLISVFSLSFGKKTGNTRENMDRLQATYERKLICPKCERPLINRSLVYYHEAKKCPHCQAKFFS